MQYSWPWARNICPRFVYLCLSESSSLLEPDLSDKEEKAWWIVHTFIPVLRLSFQFCWLCGLCGFTPNVLSCANHHGSRSDPPFFQILTLDFRAGLIASRMSALRIWILAFSCVEAELLVEMGIPKLYKCCSKCFSPSYQMLFWDYRPAESQDGPFGTWERCRARLLAWFCPWQRFRRRTKISCQPLVAIRWQRPKFCPRQRAVDCQIHPFFDRWGRICSWQYHLRKCILWFQSTRILQAYWEIWGETQVRYARNMVRGRGKESGAKGKYLYPWTSNMN